MSIPRLDLGSSGLLFYSWVLLWEAISESFAKRQKAKGQGLLPSCRNNWRKFGMYNSPFENLQGFLTEGVFSISLLFQNANKPNAKWLRETELHYLQLKKLDNACGTWTRDLLNFRPLANLYLYTIQNLAGFLSSPTCVHYVY